MDDSNDGTTTNDDGTSTYDNGTTETTYGAGYGDSGVLDTYQTDTATQNDLYQESTEAMMAGDSYGSYELNEQSIEAGSDANNAYQDYNGIGDYGPTESYTPEVPSGDDYSSTDAGSYSSDTSSDAGSYSSDTSSDAGSYSSDAGSSDVSSFDSSSVDSSSVDSSSVDSSSSDSGSSDASSDIAGGYADYAGS